MGAAYGVRVTWIREGNLDPTNVTRNSDCFAKWNKNGYVEHH